MLALRSLGDILEKFMQSPVWWSGVLKVVGGIIDTDDKGLTVVLFFNFSNKAIDIDKDDRFCQIVFQKIANHPVLREIKLVEEKDHLDQQIILNICAGKIFASSYVPEYVLQDLPWYERDGLMTYIDQLKWKEFISDPDVAIRNTKIKNFEMIHAQCRGTHRTHSNEFCQTVRQKNVAKMPQKDRKKTVSVCLSSERKDVFVEKTLVFSHFF